MKVLQKLIKAILALILGDEAHSRPQYWNFNRPKKNSNSISSPGNSEQTKPLQLVAAEFKFEPMFKPLLVICKSLPKAITEDDRRF